MLSSIMFLHLPTKSSPVNIPLQGICSKGMTQQCHVLPILVFDRVTDYVFGVDRSVSEASGERTDHDHGQIARS